MRLGVLDGAFGTMWSRKSSSTRFWASSKAMLGACHVEFFRHVGIFGTLLGWVRWCLCAQNSPQTKPLKPDDVSCPMAGRFVVGLQVLRLRHAHVLHVLVKASK